jgi:hypothetical protein
MFRLKELQPYANFSIGKSQILIFVAIIVLNTVFKMLHCPVVGKNVFYKAAVYEHAVIFPDKVAESYEEAFIQMSANLNIYKIQADVAGQLVSYLLYILYIIYASSICFHDMFSCILSGTLSDEVIFF